MSMNNPMSNVPPVGTPAGMMPGGPSKFKPIDPMRVIRGNWLWIALGLIVGLMIGGGGWFALEKYKAKYTSEAQFNVEANQGGLTQSGLTMPGLNRIDVLEPLILREVQTIKGEPILRQILNKPAVQATDWFKQFNGNFEDAFTALDEDVVGASHIRETPLFVVRATTGGEEDSQTILTALSDEYLRLKTQRVSDESAQAMRAAQGQRDDAEQRIASTTVQIDRFLADTPLSSTDPRTTQEALEIQRLVIEQAELNQAFNSLQASYNQLLQRQAENDFEPSDEERVQIENSPQILSIKDQIVRLRVERETLLDRFKPEHGTVQAIDKQILTFERERDAEFDKQARIVFGATLEQAANGVAILSEEVAKANASMVELTLAQQENVRLIQAYETLQRAQEQAESDREEAVKLIAQLETFHRNDGRTIVESYVPPQKAKQTFPPKPYVMIPGVGVLFMGLATGLVFLRELLDQRVRSAQDVKMIPDASLIGMIPSVSQDRDAKSVDRIVENQPSGLIAEAFRQTRTALLSKIDRRGYKTLMMVSAKPGSGVTSCSHNLAVSCARSGRKVLLIDADFRRPGLAPLMSLNSQPGLAEALTSRQAIDELIQPSSVDGLSLLAAGDTAQAAVELFESQYFRELLAKLEAAYDLIIIDAPPAFLASDAQLLSRHVDAMLLVTRAQSDTRGMLQRLYRELDGQRADILGVLLNGVEASVGGYMKRNFREFHEYRGPERRKTARTAVSRANGAVAQPVQIEEDDNDATQIIPVDEMDEINLQDSDEQKP